MIPFTTLRVTFYINYFYLYKNPSKCCYISFSSNHDKGGLILKDNIEILRVTIDNRLTFYNHLKYLCKKIANKLNSLTRITPYLNHNEIRIQLII